MKKRVFSFLLTLCLMLTLLPTGVLAYVGAIQSGNSNLDFSQSGSEYILQNDYIYFSINSTTGAFVLSPTGGTRENRAITPQFYVDYAGQSERQLQVQSITITRSNDANTSTMLHAVYTFRNDQYEREGDVDITYEADFRIVCLDEGSSSGTTGSAISQVAGDPGTTWALLVEGEYYWDGTRDRLPDGTGGDNGSLFAMRCTIPSFNSLGHPNLSGGGSAPVMISKAYGSNLSGYQHSATNISQGLDWTAVHPDENNAGYFITEVFVDSYSYANPFVGTSRFYGYNASGLQDPYGVKGFRFDTEFPRSIRYEQSGSRLTLDTTFNLSNDPTQGNSNPADLLIGYRNLVNTASGQVPTNPDEVTVSSNADRLAVYYNNGIVTVIPCEGSGGISGSPVAVIRGDFELVNGAYNFTGGAAALSPTVTATWSGNNSCFRIKTDGTVEQNGVHLNAPTFKFYQPSAGFEGALSLSFNSDGLQMSNMGSNDAVLSVDLPGSTTSVSSGTAKTDGSLTFAGTLSFSNMFSQQALNMTELSYALRGSSFTVEGLRAEGEFANASLLGISLGEVRGSIDTFKNTYDFTAEIDVFGLLEAAGELQLKRANSGELMPNNLYFEVNSRIPVSLVPPVPVVKLTGGGAGFYNLVDTINGSWYAIPPLTFRGSVNAQIVELLAAEGANIVLGPSQYELSVDSLKIAGTNFSVFSGGIGMYLGGDQVEYEGTAYTGLAADGRIWLRVDLPSQSLNFLVFDGSLSAGVFGGTNAAGDQLYMRAYGNSRTNARLQFPDSWPLVGGWKLLGVGVDAAIAGQTVADASSGFSQAMESAFNNLDLQVGLAATGSFLGSDVRVWVILPDVARNADEDWNWGWDFKFWGSLGRWNWDGTAMGTYSAVSTNPASVGAAVPATFSANEPASKTITVENVEDEETAYLVLSFPETTEIDLDEVSVTKSGPDSFSFTPVQIEVQEVDGEEYIANGDTANILLSDPVPLAEGQGTGSERVLVIKLGQGPSYNGTYTVSFGEDNSLQPAYSTANVVSPADGLGGMGVSDSGSIEVDVEYPEAGADYILRTYLGTNPDGTDYLVDEREVENLDEDNTVRFDIPLSGTAAPSGSYYVTSYLLKEVTYTDADDVDQKAYIAIDSKGSSQQLTYTYTNTNAPADAPQNVTLAAAGNETMTASWQAPSDATNVDGYRITIYEQEGDNWVDSGRGYEYDVSQFQATLSSGDDNPDYMPGLSLSADGTYSINMAVTAGGAVSEDDEPVTLEAGKSYKVGVTAYNNVEVTMGEETRNVKYYGPEAQNSDGVYLPEYTPLDMRILYDTVDAEPVELTADGNGIYNLSVRAQGSDSLGLIQLSDNKNASYTVTRMDTNDQIPNTDGEFYVPNFEGTLMLAITGSVTSGDGITDTTTRYILISRDETAPIVTLDTDVFYANSSGSYTVTGVTEPGAKVELNDYYGAEAVADEQGKFSVESTLDSDSGSLLLNVTATDAAGNEGSDDAIVSRQTGTTDPDEPDDPGTSDSGGSSAATYPPTITDTENGTVSVSPSRPSRGRTVTITAEPEEGFEVDEVIVTDRNGDAVTVTAEGGGKYTFTQPSGRVTITVTFRAADSVSDCTGDESCPMAQFTDVNMDGWYHDGVHYCIANGLMNGVSADEFDPNGTLTRAMMVTVLYRMEGEPAVSGAADFEDVADDTWYTDAVAWAAANGIVNGISETEYAPNSNITREQLATMLYRYAAYKAYGTSAAGDLEDYSDAENVSDYAAEALTWAVDAELVNGMGDNTLAPKGSATRAQTATLLMRFIETFEA